MLNWNVKYLKINWKVGWSFVDMLGDFGGKLIFKKCYVGKC